MTIVFWVIVVSLLWSLAIGGLLAAGGAADDDLRF